LTDEAPESGIVARSATNDHRDLTLWRDRAAHDAARHLPDVPFVRGDEAGDHLVGEIRGVIPEPRHRIAAPSRDAAPMRTASMRPGKMSTVTPE
jgi:hypothetical protein